MSTIYDKALLVRLSISVYAAKKTDKRVTKNACFREGAVDEAGHFRKNLFPKANPLVELNSHCMAWRLWHYSQTLPWLDEGARILPSGKFMEYQAETERRKTRAIELRDQFLAVYRDSVEKAKADLRGMWSDKDYPPLSKVLKKFNFELTYLPIPRGDDFRTEWANVDMEILKEDLAKAVADTEIKVTRSLWERLAKPVQAMVETLGEKDSTRFHDTLVSNLHDAIEAIPGLNILNDPDLEQVRADLKNRINGVTTASLKADPALRKTTANTAKEMLDRINAFLP